MDTARRLGRRLYDTFLGSAGAEYLEEHRPTALMIDADETDLDLPWELVADAEGPLALRYPLGRIVSTRSRPRPERDPTVEDRTIAVLAVVDPVHGHARRRRGAGRAAPARRAGCARA